MQDFPCIEKITFSVNKNTISSSVEISAYFCEQDKKNKNFMLHQTIFPSVSFSADFTFEDGKKKNLFVEDCGECWSGLRDGLVQTSISCSGILASSPEKKIDYILLTEILDEKENVIDSKELAFNF